MSRLVVSVHDVAAATAEEAAGWIRRFDERGIRVVVKVVPGPYRGRSLRDAPGLVHELRRAVERGHEICLHGWDHAARGGAGPRALFGRVVARGAEEFWLIGRDEAEARLEWGIEELRALGLDPAGFTPPGWLASRPARDAADATGLGYVTDHVGVSFGDGGRVRSPAWCYRGGSTAYSPSARWVLGATFATLRMSDVGRFAVHPVDARDEGLVDMTLDAVTSLLEQGTTPATFSELAAA